ncbi:HAD family hydrolase [Rhizorhapis sp. SPR117]|uniref:HAD family hydrolase n=1 Tax=Rhizorhapis sp. SPR117 TaxID=2912611 RepID=UPI001F30ED2C|nr:HAD family hydrolase [Rhizorhapis sp. SPR117]
MNWDDIDLIIFDVDGTLYDQRRLRARMLAALMRQTIRSGSLHTIRVLRTFRQYREALGEEAGDDFVNRQYALTATQCGCSVENVRNLVSEWIEQRPLRHFHGYRYPGVQPLFEALAASNRTIAIFSDYPAAAKLDALGLKPHLVVSANDEDVGRLKPDPAGLYKILRLTGMDAGRSLMVGDRFDRDWEAARRVGMRAIIRSRRPGVRADTFFSYTDPLFQPILRAARGLEGNRTQPGLHVPESPSIATGHG